MTENKFWKIILITFSWLLIAATSNAQDISINEFMASNATTIADEDGDFEDWIELYNYGDHDINLAGWGLSDDYSNPARWIFPQVTIPAGSYLMVWASGKDRTDGQLHTNFRISSQGEELILTDPQGNWIDEVSPLHLPTDISYGRYPNGSGDFQYYQQPTPGQPNTSNYFEEMLEPPLFSHSSGFYSDSFYLKVVHTDPEATLRFTLDGSVPTAQSELFPDSLLIYNRENDPDQISAIPTTPPTAPEWFRWQPPMDTVFKGTNIRIKAFKEGALSPFTATRTYWVHPDMHSRYSLPVISISMDQDDLLGPSGIYTNFNQSGPNWERDMHFALFEPDGTEVFATDAGIRVHGGNSRRYALKSFRTYFRNQYGESHLDYPVFSNQEMNIHDRLILRNAGSDWAYTYYRDAFIQHILHGISDVEKQAYHPAVVFLNSEYWGILNIRERFDNNYIENHYGYTEIDMLDNTGQVKYGSNAHYMNLLSFLQNNNLEEPENYEWVKTQMDVDDFRDYHILQVFSMNTDQPGKNVRFWRPQTEDGRWRWMWWDMDDSFIFGPHNNYDRNALVYCTGLDSISATTVNPATPPPAWAPNGPNQTFPLRALLGSPEFRQDFIIRFADLLNTAFQPSYLLNLIDDFDEKIGPYLYEHYRRWHRPTPELYAIHRQRLIDFSENRLHYMRDHMEEFFELDGRYALLLDIGEGLGHIRINSIGLNESMPALEAPVYPWTGVYFAGIPIEVEAIAAPGYLFSHWEGSTEETDALLTMAPAEDMNLTAHFVKTGDSLDLITFWYFDTDMPNNTPLESLVPYYSQNEGAEIIFKSALEGYPFHEDHPLWRKASMERRNQPTPLNYRPEALDDQEYDPEDMRALQIKQPFQNEGNENKLFLHLPTTGYENIALSFALMNEGAIDAILVDYALSDQNNWTTEGLLFDHFETGEEYTLFRADFSHLEEAADNEEFRIRLRFETEDPFADHGDRITFNNIALEGIPVIPTMVSAPEKPEQLVVFPNPVKQGSVVYLNKKTDLRIYDLHGRKILDLQNVISLDPGALSPGIYLLMGSDGEKTRLIIL